MILDLTGPTPITEAYEYSKERFKNVSFEDFLHSFIDWRIVGFYHGRKCAGVVFIKDGWVHISVNPKYRKRWASKRLIRQIISLAAVNGIARTTVFKNDPYRQKFAERLGFIRNGEVVDAFIYEVKNA